MLTHRNSWGKNGDWWTSSALHAFCLPPQGGMRDNDKQGHWFDFNPAYSFIWDNDKKVTTVTCNLFAMSHHCHLKPVCNVSLRSLPTCLQCLTAVTCNLFAMSHRLTVVSSKLFAMSHHSLFQPVCNVSLQSLPTCLQRLTIVTSNLFAMSWRH